MALASRFLSKRSIRRESNSAKISSVGNLTSIELPRFLASGSIDAIAIPTTWFKSCISSSALTAPASYLEISRRSFSNTSNRTICPWSNSADLRRVGSSVSLASNNKSPASLIVVSGVRSSCETSDTNLCCIFETLASLVICRCKLSAILLKERAREAITSSPFSSSRTSSAPSAISSETSAAIFTGRTSQLVTTKETPPMMKISANPPINKVC